MGIKQADIRLMQSCFLVWNAKSSRVPEAIKWIWRRLTSFSRCQQNLSTKSKTNWVSFAAFGRQSESQMRICYPFETKRMAWLLRKCLQLVLSASSRLYEPRLTIVFLQGRVGMIDEKLRYVQSRKIFGQWLLPAQWVLLDPDEGCCYESGFK